MWCLGAVVWEDAVHEVGVLKMSPIEKAITLDAFITQELGESIGWNPCQHYQLC
jgi:hypothetical protein